MDLEELQDLSDAELAELHDELAMARTDFDWPVRPEIGEAVAQVLYSVAEEIGDVVRRALADEIAIVEAEQQARRAENPDAFKSG